MNETTFRRTLAGSIACAAVAAAMVLIAAWTGDYRWFRAATVPGALAFGLYLTVVRYL